MKTQIQKPVAVTVELPFSCYLLDGEQFVTGKASFKPCSNAIRQKIEGVRNQ